jgi:hypothetical protein
MSMEPEENNRRALRRAKRTFIINRRNHVMKLYFERTPQHIIAIQLGISPALVSEDIKASIAAYKRHYQLDTMALIVEEVERINRLEAQASEAYERSCQKKTIGTAGTGVRGPSSGATIIDRPEGDVTFLKLVLDCVKARIKLLRLDKHDEDDKVDDADLGLSFGKIIAAYWAKKDKEDAILQQPKTLELGDGKLRRSCRLSTT